MAVCYNSEFFRLRIPTGDSGIGEEFASGVGESENKTSVPVDDCVSKVVLLESSLGK